MTSNKTKTSTRKVKSLKPKSVGGKKAKDVKGGFPSGPPQFPQGPPQMPVGPPSIKT